MTDKTCDNERCNICKAIREQRSRWCFEWLRHLKDFEASQVIADKDRQLHLMVNQADNKVSHIRSRLAILQTQTVKYSSVILKVQGLIHVISSLYGK
jgi:hypothetical protein